METYKDNILESSTLISDVVNRVLNNTACTELYVWKERKLELNDVYPSVKVIQHRELNQLIGKTVYCRIDDINDVALVKEWAWNKKRANILIYVPDDNLVRFFDDSIGEIVCLSKFSRFKGYIILCGELFCPMMPMTVPDDFKVLAIIHFFNEEDILAKTIEYLLNQNVDIYLLDNWSTDGSYNIAHQYKVQYPDHVYLEKFPALKAGDNFELYKQLERTEYLAKQMDYDWFIHYDADEIRVSFWENISLRDTIYRVDRLGYNCIENTVIDFKITSADNQNIFMKDTYFDFGHRKTHFKQVKTWKRTDTIELKQSGGHIASVENPSIFPLKILNRHYPLRSLRQSQKKVFLDRKPRFIKERRERGWHEQYEKYEKCSDFIESKKDLLLWTCQTFKELYIPIVMGCGIKIEKNEIGLRSGLQSIINKKIIIYGAGEWGREVCLSLMKKNEIVKWVDRNHTRLPMAFCIMIESPDGIEDTDYDYLIIALKSEKLRKEIKENLITYYRVSEKKIV